MTTPSRPASDAHQCSGFERNRGGGDHVLTPPRRVRLRGSIASNTSGAAGSEKFWHLLHSEKVVSALVALSGNHAIEECRQGSRPSIAPAAGLGEEQRR